VQGFHQTGELGGKGFAAQSFLWVVVLGNGKKVVPLQPKLQNYRVSLN
jgi:hypothetical protein